MADLDDKLTLHGFNNLTKTLSFNIYDISYALTREAQQQYIDYIDETYNAERLTRILSEVADIIGAEILNIARQDYDPQGASVTMLISEGGQGKAGNSTAEMPGPKPDAVVGHLDKSHVTVHTYPEQHPDNGISTFRADIDVSTCGHISPLRALNFLIHSFESDIVILDYRVRGFTRDVRGHKHYIDHTIHSIQNYIDASTLARFQAVDVNVYPENIFHTKLRVRNFDLANYLFGVNDADLSAQEQAATATRLEREIQEIFYATNMK
jgi:S-adenosylmethionine decarboxylase